MAIEKKAQVDFLMQNSSRTLVHYPIKLCLEISRNKQDLVCGLWVWHFLVISYSLAFLFSSDVFVFIETNLLITYY